MQFRLAYIAPESRVVGAGELVDHPKKIAQNYLRGFFFVDLFVVLPLPQVSLFHSLSCTITFYFLEFSYGFKMLHLYASF